MYDVTRFVEYVDLADWLLSFEGEVVSVYSMSGWHYVVFKR